MCIEIRVCNTQRRRLACLLLAGSDILLVLFLDIGSDLSIFLLYTALYSLPLRARAHDPFAAPTPPTDGAFLNTTSG